jgi:hypothetical protein
VDSSSEIGSFFEAPFVDGVLQTYTGEYSEVAQGTERNESFVRRDWAPIRQAEMSCQLGSVLNLPVNGRNEGLLNTEQKLRTVSCVLHLVEVH